MFTQTELLKKIDAAIESLTYSQEPRDLYEPIRYVLSLGGKRVRPLLMLMAYNLYREDVDTIMPNAVALETCHNFTLLHDDVMDRAEMRRGKPCVHKVWTENQAILSGDAMLILAYRMMAEHRFTDQEPLSTPHDREAKALNTFTEATLEVCEGQQLDIDFETRSDVTESEYLEMIRLKTSVLLAAALKIGALLAGASSADAQNLYEYGEKMGLAFQLQDDMLDVYGDPAVFGKKIGGDILSNKKTYLLIQTLTLANDRQRAELEAWLGRTEYDAEAKITAVRAIYDALDIRQLCEKKIASYFDEAQKNLAAVAVDDARKTHLQAFADELMGRTF